MGVEEELAVLRPSFLKGLMHAARIALSRGSSAAQAMTEPSSKASEDIVSLHSSIPFCLREDCATRTRQRWPQCLANCVEQMLLLGDDWIDSGSGGKRRGSRSGDRRDVVPCLQRPEPRLAECRLPIHDAGPGAHSNINSACGIRRCLTCRFLRVSENTQLASSLDAFCLW